MTLVLTTWMWATAISAVALIVLIVLQRLLLGPATPVRRPTVALGGPAGVLHRDPAVLADLPQAA